MPKPYWEQLTPHTKAKLELLERYLGAWFGILAQATDGTGRHHFNELVYLDGFCGRGEYSDGQRGSPLIAVQFANQVAERRRDLKIHVILVDKIKKNVTHLKTLASIKRPHPQVKITPIHGSFDDTVVGVFDMLKVSPNAPTFSFVDPFGIIHEPEITFSRLMRNQSSELFINFMAGYVNRFLRDQRNNIREAFISAIGLEAAERVLAENDRIAALAREYTNKLHTFGEFVRVFQMRDETNVRDNAFFFCGNNSIGFKKIKEAMWKIDPENGMEFSAYRFERSKDQIELLPTKPYLHPLRAEVLYHFSGRKDVLAKDLKQWADFRSERFLYSHLRFVLEDLVAYGTVTYDPPPSETQKRRKNTWPDAGSFSFSRPT